MKVDNALQHFTETYDQEAMGYVDRLSKEIGLTAHRYKMTAVNLRESFDQFNSYLEGYAKYKKENKDNPKASPQEKIKESTTRFCESLFKPADLQYSEVVQFVTSYLEGVQKLTQTVDRVKSDMMEAGIDQDAIGDVNDFTDQFMEKADAAFYPLMEKIVRASGYTTRKALAKDAPKKPAPVFL